MSKQGTIHQGESSDWVCPDTGAAFKQLTSASVHSRAFYFEQTSFTADDQTIVFASQRTAGRGVPWDFFRVDIDGKNLVQLSDEEHSFVACIPSPSESRIIYITRGPALLKVDIDTFDETEIGRVDGFTNEGLGTLTGDGRWFFCVAVDDKDPERRVIARWDIQTGEVVTFCDGVPWVHLTIDWGGTVLSFRGRMDTDGYGYYLCDVDGGNLRTFHWDNFAHNTFYGRTAKLQGTMLPPGHGIGIMALDDEGPEMVCEGPYFWHSGVSEDGEWIVSDTNWPDQGLMLVHVPTKRFAPLVMSNSSNGSSQEAHPHPSFNRAATKVIYTSDRTGLSQVYLCDIPEALRHDLLTGELTNRLRHSRQ